MGNKAEKFKLIFCLKTLISRIISKTFTCAIMNVRVRLKNLPQWSLLSNTMPAHWWQTAIPRDLFYYLPSTFMMDYKNLSWMWGWNRKICHEDHHLASWGLQWSWGTDFFYSTLIQIMDSFSWKPMTVYFKINFENHLIMLRCIITWWCHFDRTTLTEHSRHLTICLIDLLLYVPVKKISVKCRDGSYWVEPVLS